MEELLKKYADIYNDLRYFKEDPIAFPRRFDAMRKRGEADRRDVEISALIAAHLAWGRRSMIVRDCTRVFDEMGWKPYDYVMKGEYRNEPLSLHRTIKWQDFAAICGRLRTFYDGNATIESLSPDAVRTEIYGQKSDLKAANKKINMMRRWLVRSDGKVDIGIWKDTSPRVLIIPLDTHVHTQALNMGLTKRRQADFRTADEITDFFRHIFPDDPCMGDFALFGYGIANN